MDLRSTLDGLPAIDRIEERRKRIEREWNIELLPLQANPNTIGDADEKNCEQMFGQVPIPIGLAGPLCIHFSNNQSQDIFLPLATTEGALVASVNRGCKAITAAGGATVQSMNHGVTRSLAFKIVSDQTNPLLELQHHEKHWQEIGESTSHHLKILSYDIDSQGDYLFLNIACDTDEAMGMNMVTMAAQAIGEWIEQEIVGLRFITVAGNVDSDKKPSVRTHQRGRGHEVTASVTIPRRIIETTLKSSIETMAETAKAKLETGSKVAGAIGANLHAANIIAALYLATGQDAAHVVEGSLTDTTVSTSKDNLTIRVRLPAILVGVRGGGTGLPAQAKAMEILLREKTDLHPVRQLAETIGAAVLAGELSLLAAQASQTLAKAHKKLGR